MARTYLKKATLTAQSGASDVHDIVQGILTDIEAGGDDKAREYAVKFRFGEIVKADYAPGLPFTLTFVNNILQYPDRILNYSESQERFLTGEKKNLIVDYFIT